MFFFDKCIQRQKSFLSPEAAILLVSTDNSDLQPVPIFEHAESICSALFSQSDSSDLKISLLILQTYGVGGGQRSRFLVLPKRIMASGDENETAIYYIYPIEHHACALPFFSASDAALFH